MYCKRCGSIDDGGMNCRVCGANDFGAEKPIFHLSSEAFWSQFKQTKVGPEAGEGPRKMEGSGGMSCFATIVLGTLGGLVLFLLFGNSF
jgi:hypothetical protein